MVLTYLAYPYVDHQRMAREHRGRLLVRTQVATPQLFQIDLTTGALTTVAVTTGHQMELPDGLYYIRVARSLFPTMYERYPVYVRTERYQGDGKVIDLDPEITRSPRLDRMIMIQGGWFTMGDDAGRDDERAAHQVKLIAYYLDRFELTNAEYKLFLKEVDDGRDHRFGHDDEPAGADCHPTPWYGVQPPDYFTSPEYDNYPVTNIDWFAAYAYCAWAGKRLPTEAEWKR
jgi:formylglycine-generating enzyme required for sulfatase activity